MSLFVMLDVAWPDHPKLIRAGMDGRGLHATVLCLAKRLETDGWIDRLILHRDGADDELIDRLVDLDLLEADGGRVRPWGWHDRNPSQGAIDAIRATKRMAAKRGNHKRWEHPGEVEDCPICWKDDTKPQVVAGCDPIGSDATPKRSPYTESETETTSPPAPPAETDPSPGGPVAAVGEDQQPVEVDEQAVRRTAALIGHAAADDPTVGNPGGYAASVTRRILRDPDAQADRDEIRRRLATDETPEAIAASWDDLGVVLGPAGRNKPPGDSVNPSAIWHRKPVDCARCDGMGVYLDAEASAHSCNHELNNNINAQEG